MKELILNPLILPLILLAGVIYLLLAYNFISWNKKLANFVEEATIFLFLFQIPALSVGMFPKLHPAALYHREKTIASAVVQLGVYVAVLLILSPQLYRNLKDIIYKVGFFLIKDPFFFLFLFLALMSSFWSETPSYTLKTGLVLLLVTVISVYIGKRFTFEKIAQLLRWSLALNFILSAYYASAVPSIGINPTKSAWQGINSHSNPFAALMALSSALWLIEVLTNPKNRSLSAIFTLLSLYGLQMAKSAGAKVNFLGLFLLFLVTRFVKKLSFRWAFFVMVIFLVIGIGGTLIVTENLEAIVVGGLGKDLTISGRTPLWSYLLTEKVPQHPWLGYGYHGFWQSWRGKDNPAANAPDGKLWMPSGDGYWAPPHAHNGFFEILLDLGWVGFILFGLSFFRTFTDSIKYLIKRKQGVTPIDSALPLIVFLFVIFPNLTISRLVEPNEIWCLYTIIATGTALSNIKNRSKGEVRSVKTPSIRPP
ncbi:O-antigen ligase family protein [Oxynema sp. CENA135]|uniref:O-antigen ligase family protein n=1 Tax=Oxynema sp. CENA135 TaxID=984206 RepID=UPI00190BE6F1|nr:O-antigen ligase family protein [Oxynema sp. CENA135]